MANGSGRNVVSILIDVKNRGAQGIKQVRDGLRSIGQQALASGRQMQANLVAAATGTVDRIKGVFSRVGGIISASLSGAFSGFAGALSLVGIQQALTKFVDVAEQFSASLRRLRGSANLVGAPLEFVTDLARKGREEFSLDATEANQFAAELTTVAAKTGDLANAQRILGPILDLGAAQGLKTAETLALLEQAADGNERALRKLFNLKPDQIFDRYAASVGKSKEELDDYDKAQAFVNTVLEKGAAAAGEYALFVNSASGKQDDLNDAIQDTAAAIGLKLQPSFLNMLQGFLILSDALLGIIALFETVGSVAGAAFFSIVDAVEGTAKAIASIVLGVSTSFRELLAGNLDAAKDALADGFRNAGKTLGENAKEIINNYRGAWDSIRESFGRMGDLPELTPRSLDPKALEEANRKLREAIELERKRIRANEAREKAAEEAKKRALRAEQDSIDVLAEKAKAQALTIEDVDKLVSLEQSLRERLKDKNLTIDKERELRGKLADVLAILEAHQERAANAEQKRAELAAARLQNELRLIQLRVAAGTGQTDDLERLNALEKETLAELEKLSRIRNKNAEELEREILLRERLAEIRGTRVEGQESAIRQELTVLRARIDGGRELEAARARLGEIEAATKKELADHLALAERTPEAVARELRLRERLATAQALLVALDERLLDSTTKQLQLIQQRVSAGRATRADRENLRRIEEQLETKLRDQTLTLEQQLALLQQLNEVRGIRQATEDLTLFRNELQEAIAGPLTEFFQTGITGFKNLGEAALNFVRSVADALAGLAAQFAARGILSALFGAFSGGGGTLFDLLAGGFAEGGVIRGPGGPKDDRILIAASAGEGVLTAETVQALGGAPGVAALNRLGKLGQNYALSLESVQLKIPRFAEGGVVDVQGAASSTTVDGTITVSLGDGLVLSQLDTPGGQKVQIQAVRKNRQAFRRALGLS